MNHEENINITIFQSLNNKIYEYQLQCQQYTENIRLDQDKISQKFLNKDEKKFYQLNGNVSLVNSSCNGLLEVENNQQIYKVTKIFTVFYSALVFSFSSIFKTALSYLFTLTIFLTFIPKSQCLCTPSFKLSTGQQHPSSPYILKFTDDYKRFISIDSSNIIKVWGFIYYNNDYQVRLIQNLNRGGGGSYESLSYHNSLFLWNNGQKMFIAWGDIRLFTLDTATGLYNPTPQILPSVGIFVISLAVTADGNRIYVGTDISIKILQWTGSAWSTSITMPSLSAHFTSKVKYIKLSSNQQRLFTYGVDNLLKIFHWNGTDFLIHQIINTIFIASMQINCKVSDNQQIISCYGGPEQPAQFSNYVYNPGTILYEDISAAATFTNAQTNDVYMNQQQIQYTIIQELNLKMIRYQFNRVGGVSSYTQIDQISFISTQTYYRLIYEKNNNKYFIVSASSGDIYLHRNQCEPQYTLNSSCVCQCISPKKQVLTICSIEFLPTDMMNCISAQRLSNLSVICLTCSRESKQIIVNNRCVCDVGYTYNSFLNKCQCLLPLKQVTNICGDFTSYDMMNCVSAYLDGNGTIVCRECSMGFKQVVWSVNNRCQCMIGYRRSVVNWFCEEICGDGVAIYLQCDDGNNQNKDGCNSTCGIQQRFFCLPTNSSSQPTLCKVRTELRYSDDVYMNRINEQHIGQLKLNLLNTPLSAPIPILTRQFQPISNYVKLFITIPNSSPKTQIQITNVELISIDSSTFSQTLYIRFPYEFTIQNTSARLWLNYQNTHYMNTTQQIEFVVKGETYPLVFTQNLAAYKGIGYANLVGTILSILILFFGLFSTKFIGLQMIITLQLIYLSQMLIQNINEWPIGFIYLNNLKFSLGFSDLLKYSYFQPFDTLTIKLSNLGIKKMFIENFNIGFVLLMVSFIICLVLFVVQSVNAMKIKRMNEERKNGKNSQQNQFLTISLLQKHKFLSKIIQKVFNTVTNFTYWSILPFIASMGSYIFIYNKYILLNDNSSPLLFQYVHIFIIIQKVICLLSFVVMMIFGLNYFWNLLINRIVLDKYMEKIQQYVYKRALFVYLIVMGSFIMLFSNSSYILFDIVPASMYVLIMEIVYSIVVFLSINPYKRALTIHTICLSINHFIFTIFLIVINLINLLDNIDELVILLLGYFQIGCCGVVVVLSVIRLYYQYRYGEELEDRIQKQKQQQQQLLKLKQNQLIQIRRQNLQLQAKKRLNQKQKQRQKNEYFYENEIKEKQKQELIDWLDNRDWKREDKDKYFYTKFHEKPVSWMEKNNQRQYDRFVEERRKIKEERLKKAQEKQNDPQYQKQISRLNEQFTRGINLIQKNFKHHQKQIIQDQFPNNLTQKSDIKNISSFTNKTNNVKK